MSEVKGFADNNGTRIRFAVSGHGRPVLLHHGFGRSLGHWSNWGYIDALAPSFRLIAMDARGHGESDKPYDEAEYTLELRTADIVAVLDAVGVEKVHYWGYSMGARTGFAFLQMHGDRAASFVNGASGPRSPQSEQDSIRERAKHLSAGKLTFTVSDGGNFNMPAGNDPKALAAAALGLLSWDGVDSATLRAPSLHYAGDADRLSTHAESAAARMPGAIFRSLPRLNHLQGFERSDLVIPFVRDFLDAQPA